jgi:cell division protein FtsL
MRKLLLSNKIFFGILIALVLLLIVLFSTVGRHTIGLSGKIEEVESKIAETQNAYFTLQQENSELQAILNSGDFAELYEKYAKENGYIYPEEHVYYVP